MDKPRWAVDWLPLAAAGWLLVPLVAVWMGRRTHPYDLEWMEGGMLAHAWRLAHDLPLYVPPGPDWIPMIYPPGYPWIVSVLGVDYGVARTVSLVGTLAAAAAVAWIVGRVGKDTVMAGCAAVVFLGCYEASGAFYDLVRPDGLYMGLTAWAIAVAIERFRGAPVVAGLLLFAAFTVKHNAAVFGIPLLAGIWIRDGWKGAAAFTAASALPALAFVGILEAASDGAFLTYLLEVPRSHPVYPLRAFPGPAREVGMTLPVAWLLAGTYLVLRPARENTTWAPEIRIGLPLLTAALGAWIVLGAPLVKGIPPVAWWGNLLAGLVVGGGCGAVAVNGLEALVPAGRPVDRKGLAIGVFSVVAMGVVGWGAVDHVASGVSGIMDLVMRAGGGVALFAAGVWVAAVVVGRVDWRWALGVGVAGVALIMAAWMRGHHGGFLNVFIHLHWVVAVGLGVAAARLRALAPEGERRIGALIGTAVVVAAQLLWLGWGVNWDRFVPTERDRSIGDEIVAMLEGFEGPVLSPYAPYLAVQAGHAPSFHLIALWDVAQHKEGPYRGVAKIPEAARDHHWGVVVDGPRPMGFGVTGQGRTPYRLETRLTGKGFAPKTGWPARPRSIHVPRGR